jgi:hypothetical protein
MDKAAIDIAKALMRLSALTIFELRGEWRRLHRTPPMRLSSGLLTRGITYKLQERAYGGLSTATARKLEQAAAGPPSRGAAKSAPPISLKPGTRLVREWRCSPSPNSSARSPASASATSKQDSNQSMHLIGIAFSRRETRAKLRRYINRFLKHWRLSGRGEAFRAYEW